MIEGLYNNIPALLIIGIIAYAALWIACNILYKLQANDILNFIHTSHTIGIFEPMLKFTPNFGNIKFRGFCGIILYLVLGIIDFFVELRLINGIFLAILMLGVFNSFTLLLCFIRALKAISTPAAQVYHDGRFLKGAYICLLIFRIVLFFAYMVIFLE